MFINEYAVAPEAVTLRRYSRAKWLSHTASLHFGLGTTSEWFRLVLWAVLRLSCKPGRDVIPSLYEDYHRTVARAAGSGYRSGIAWPEDFKVSCSS